MPHYDLRCIECSGEYNIRATMTEKAQKLIPCPNCGSFELETVYKAAPAYVKGTQAAGCPNVGSCGSRCPHGG